MAAICKQYFQIRFLGWKLILSNSSFTEIRLPWSDCQWTSIGLNDASAPVRSQTIIWTNEGLDTASRIYYSDVIMSAMASQITGVSIVCWTVGSCTDQSKHQSSASLAFVRGIHRWPVSSPHKRTVRQKTFPFYDVIMHLRDGMSAWRPISQILTHLLLAPHLCVSELRQQFRHCLGYC